jgi:protoporphyrinogen IX oxidase
VVTWAAGLWLAWMFSFQGGWLHAKIALVLVLSGMHGYLSASQRRFARDENRKSAKFWRSVNEIPAVLMVLIVILVVVKPF